MKVSAISANNGTNFGGVRKVVSTINGAKVTRFISPKGKDLGQHVVTKDGNISGIRRFVDGLTVQYGISHLPTYGTPSYATMTIRNTNPRLFESGLTVGSYNLNADYFRKNYKNLLTKKGIITFVAEQEKKLQKLAKAKKVEVSF